MNSKKIAVTGGLSSGKSTVCHLFEELGAYVVSADEIVHRLLKSDTKVVQQVIDLFGTDILTNGQIDRSKISEKAFSNSTLLQTLEHLIHPLVRTEIEQDYLRCRNDYPLFIAEIPLLFESGLDKDYAQTIAVVAAPEKCQQRFEKIRSSKNKEYHQRAEQQFSSEEKAARATYVLDNNSSLEALKSAVGNLYRQLIANP